MSYKAVLGRNKSGPI